MLHKGISLFFSGDDLFSANRHLGCQFESGVPFSDLMNFQIPRSSVSSRAELTTSIHFSCLASSLALETSLQVSSHSFLRVLICLRRVFLLLTRDLTFGVIHAVLPFPGLVLPTCFFAALMMALLKACARSAKLAWGSDDLTAFSTACLYAAQLTPLLRQRGVLPRTGWCLVEVLMVMTMGR